MKSLNKVVLIGNVGNDPKITELKDGIKCASFNLATNERWKNKKTLETQSSTEWHNILVFNPHVIEIVEKFVKKGSCLYVEGEIKKRKYTNKEGKEIYLTEIIVKNYKGEIVVLDNNIRESNKELNDDSVYENYF